MQLWLLVVLLKVVYEAIRAVRQKAREIKPEPLCASCLHAHVQYGANVRRAISCTYAGSPRPIKLDVLYCTDYQARNLPVRNRVIGFVREIEPARNG